MNLYTANNQWQTRPSDERFANLSEMLQGAEYLKGCAIAAEGVKFGDLRVDFDNDEPVLVGSTGNRARFTHHSFGNFCQRIGIPANYMRKLPTPLMLENVKHGLSIAEDRDKSTNLLFHQNGGLFVRSIDSTLYSRIWNDDVVRALQALEEGGWRVPPARPAHDNQPGARRATAQDVLEDTSFGLSVREGDMIAPAGLYMSSHDLFAFMVLERNRIDCGTEGGMSRGFFVRNSEVAGVCSLTLTLFHYQHVCGNHIVWGAEDVKNIRIRHTGRAGTDGLVDAQKDLRVFAESSTKGLEEQIRFLSTRELGANKVEVIDAVFSRVRHNALSQRRLELAYDLAEMAGTSNPRTPWGIVDGLTRLSQNTAYADSRSEIDAAGGAVLRMKF